MGSNNLIDILEQPTYLYQTDNQRTFIDFRKVLVSLLRANVLTEVGTSKKNIRKKKYPMNKNKSERKILIYTGWILNISAERTKISALYFHEITLCYSFNHYG